MSACFAETPDQEGRIGNVATVHQRINYGERRILRRVADNRSSKEIAGNLASVTGQ